MLLDGKARQPVEEINGGEVKLPCSCKSELSLRTFAANYLPISMLGSSLYMVMILTLHVIPPTVPQARRFSRLISSPCTLATVSAGRQRHFLNFSFKFSLSQGCRHLR